MVVVERARMKLLCDSSVNAGLQGIPVRYQSFRNKTEQEASKVVTKHLGEVGPARY